MDFIGNFLASEAAQTALLGAFGFVLTFVLRKAAQTFEVYTSVRVSEKDLATFHSAIVTGVESAQKHGIAVGTATFKAHVKAHILQSSPDTFAKMSPLPDVLDNLIYRYARDAIANYGEPK